MSVTAFAIALALSLPVAGVGWLAARLIDALVADPRPRVWVWTAAFWSPLLPPAGLLLSSLAPSEARIAWVAPVADFVPSLVGPVGVVGQDSSVSPMSPTWLAVVFLAFAVAAAAARGYALVLRYRRLAAVLESATEPPSRLKMQLDELARKKGLPPPRLALSAHCSQPMLAGVLRPVLVLPDEFAEQAPDADLIIAHELAHLARRDHWSVFAEEAVVAVFGFNPVIIASRLGLSAAREEACDVAALAGSSGPARRGYAQAYLDALRRPGSPIAALTFTGSQRRYAVRRMQLILSGPRAASKTAKAMTAAVGLTLVLAGAGAAYASVLQERPSLSPAELETLLRQRVGDAAYDARRAELQNASGEDFQRMCASDDAGDDGFCSGVLIGSALNMGTSICAPELDDPAFFDASRASVARLDVGNGDTPRSVATAALQDAFPCEARPSQVLVNGALLELPANLPVELLGDEVILHDNGTREWRTAGAAPITRVRIDGALQADGFQLADLDPALVERVVIDTRSDAIEVTYRN